VVLSVEAQEEISAASVRAVNRRAMVTLEASAECPEYSKSIDTLKDSW